MKMEKNVARKEPATIGECLTQIGESFHGLNNNLLHGGRHDPQFSTELAHMAYLASYPASPNTAGM